MKSYDELTLEEKQELIRYGLRLKELHHPGYRELKGYETVVLSILSDYESLRAGRMVTPLFEYQDDIINISHSMPEYTLYELKVALDP